MGKWYEFETVLSLTRSQRIMLGLVVAVIVFASILRFVWPSQFMVGDDGMPLFGMVLLVMVLLSGGLLLFWIREHLRILYGMIELVAAMGFMAAALAQVPDLISKAIDAYSDSSLLVAIYVLMPGAAALYVFIRGLDNLGQGIETTEKKAREARCQSYADKKRAERWECYLRWWETVGLKIGKKA